MSASLPIPQHTTTYGVLASAPSNDVLHEPVAVPSSPPLTTALSAAPASPLLAPISAARPIISRTLSAAAPATPISSPLSAARPIISLARNVPVSPISLPISAARPSISWVQSGVPSAAAAVIHTASPASPISAQIPVSAAPALVCQASSLIQTIGQRSAPSAPATAVRPAAAVAASSTALPVSMTPKLTTIAKGGLQLPVALKPTLAFRKNLEVYHTTPQKSRYGESPKWFNFDVEGRHVHYVAPGGHLVPAPYKDFNLPSPTWLSPTSTSQVAEPFFPGTLAPPHLPVTSAVSVMQPPVVRRVGTPYVAGAVEAGSPVQSNPFQGA